VDDVDALAAAIVRLARDEELRARIGEAGHRRVSAEYTIERTVARYDELYRGAPPDVNT
jgi:glycosyltransferase involved in cell wall biosynthesis